MEGGPVERVHVLMSGFACRYKALANGRRQITDLLVAGDACHLHSGLLEEADHSVGTLTACSVVELSHETLTELTTRSPRIARALHWASLVLDSIAREWMLGLGQREADARMAHLFCEVLVRLQAVGLADERGYEWPITQDALADMLGCTSVHANRTLQGLREADLIVLRGKRLTLPEPARLKAFAGFKPTYLHLAERGDAAVAV